MVNRGGVPAAPPHELHVRKFAESRAPEIEGLHSIVADRLNNNLKSQRNKRRRTTGHDNRVARKKFRKRSGDGLGERDKVGSMRKDERKVPRRARRSAELKKNPSSGYGTAGDGTKRLRTHVWHAKRFKMEKLWGFYIPLGLHGRGRGSRSLLKKLKHGVLVHDASYYDAVQLEGSQDMLMSVLSSVLVPPPSTCEEILQDFFAGNIFGTAMLHDAGHPSFHSIAPVTYMWRPLQHISTNMEGLSREVTSGEENINNTTFTRQLWLWIHAASFNEAYDSLSSVCGKYTDGTCSAHCVTREGQLAKLELIGPKVFPLLHKTLQPARLNSENSWHVKKCSSIEHDDRVESEKTSIFEKGHQISTSAVISLVVKDPRKLTKKGDVNAPDAKYPGLLGNEEFQSKEQTVSSLSEDKAELLHEHGDLWDASKGVDPPVEESILCAEKHHQRKEFFCLGHKGSGPQNATADKKHNTSCPILLLKNGKFEDSVTWCSLILPLSWVKAFWIAFVSNGAHAIGLREKHWVACEIGLPYFPLDFPDCNAYSHFKAMEAASATQNSMLVPPSKRPLKVPIPPPWDCVFSNFGKRCKAGRVQGETLDRQDEKIDGMEKDSSSDKSHDNISDCEGTPFEGIVARTSSYMLNDFLNSNHLLFPRIPGQENHLLKSMRNKDFLKQDIVISETKCRKTPCFVRVLLHAFKEGVFEQGAVVCAPLAADIMLLTDSSESNDQQLQITQSSVVSYFTQLPSGKWQLQVPEDQALNDSHRCPIGFVTTGFVRGSKKPRAGALCEASLLSRLREAQWTDLPVRRRRKEIYVLVRNMRSTTYRLARATIVLEQQEQDVNFM